MRSILYYVSGHGFGHAVRSLQVIRSLRAIRPDVAVHVRTSAPAWLFHGSGFAISYHGTATDAGMVQEDSLEMLVGETLRNCRALHDAAPRLLDVEMAFVRREKIRLIVGDVPPLCFEVAARAALPSVAVANFTWDWIYRTYLTEYPAFLRLIEEMESFYRKATLALTLPYSCPMDTFQRKEPIPLITRCSALCREEARKRFGLPQAASIVLVSFGGSGLKRVAWEAPTRPSDFYFVTTGDACRREPNLLVLPDAQSQYEDLIRAADIVVSKPGYGIVSDVIAHEVPILYTSRGDFPEYPFLVEALSQCATSEFIPQEELLSGNLARYLVRLMEKEKHWPAVPLDGARVAAAKIVALMEETQR